MLRTRVHYEQAEIKRRSRQAEIKHRSRKLPTAYRLHEMKNKSCKYFEYKNLDCKIRNPPRSVLRRTCWKEEVNLVEAAQRCGL